jgi:hypothetical protein
MTIHLLSSTLSPPLHGALGVWDEIIFGVGFVLSIIIFISLAFNDRKRDVKEEITPQDDQDA